MKVNSIVTSIKYMEDLNWCMEDVIKAKNYLIEWDKRPDSFYKSKSSMWFDKSEKEHYRNCIKFWEDKLNESK